MAGAIRMPRVYSSSCYFTYTIRGNRALRSKTYSSCHPLICMEPATSQSSTLSGSIQLSRRFGHYRRKVLTSFMNLNAHCTFLCGASRHFPASRTTFSPFLVNDGRLWCYPSNAFSRSKSGSSSTFPNQSRTIPQTYDRHPAPTPSKLEWTNARDWEKLKKIYYKVPNINVGGVSQQYDNFSGDNGAYFSGPELDCNMETDALSSCLCETFTVGEQHSLEVCKGIHSDSDIPHGCTNEVHRPKSNSCQHTVISLKYPKELLDIYDKVIVVDNMSTAKSVVEMLTTEYKDLIHACDTEVSKIDVKQDTPVGHGEIVCFSIYSGPTADFGDGKSCIWVDLLDGGADIITAFAPFFENPFIKKVWHDYSFNYHVIENYGIKVSGFHADTMHLARLWDSSREINSGYSLESLCCDPVIVGEVTSEDANSTAVRQSGNIIDLTTGKICTKDIFDKKKMKRAETKIKNIRTDPVEVLQREERIPWICYSSMDSICTLKLFECLKSKLVKMDWFFEDENKGHMYDFYEKYWRPFGNLLIEMEAEGIFVDRDHLMEIEKVAVQEQRIAEEKFTNWAAEYCADAKFMNGDETQTGNSEDTSLYGTAYAAFGKGKNGRDACSAIATLCDISSIDSLVSNFIIPLQGNNKRGKDGRIHCSLNINTKTGRLSARKPNLQNPPALEKDRYKIRAAFVASPGNKLVVADYAQLELRILAHLANCKAMLDAFKTGGDFHSRTAMNMYEHIHTAIKEKRVILEWQSQPGEDKPPVPLVKDVFASERRKAKMINFSIAYGKTAHGLAKDWKVSLKEAKDILNRWYTGREEVREWQEAQKVKVLNDHRVCTLLGRACNFPLMASAGNMQRGHIERAAINAPVQGSAADVAMCAMLEISKNERLKALKWKLLLQIHDEVILEGPSESSEEAKAIVMECMSKPFGGRNILRVDLVVDAKCAQSWYDAK